MTNAHSSHSGLLCLEFAPILVAFPSVEPVTIMVGSVHAMEVPACNVLTGNPKTFNISPTRFTAPMELQNTRQGPDDHWTVVVRYALHCTAWRERPGGYCIDGCWLRGLWSVEVARHGTRSQFPHLDKHNWQQSNLGQMSIAHEHKHLS